MNTYRMSSSMAEDGVVNFYSAPIGGAIDQVAQTGTGLVRTGNDAAAKLLTTGADAVRNATDLTKTILNQGVQTVDTTANLVMQHSLIAGAVGGLLLYALTSRALYAALGVVAGYAINSALDKSQQTSIVTPMGTTTL